MMFSGQLISSKLKWKWRGDSSLNTSLLNDVPPEIELSQYGRIPSPGSESPSALLNGESSFNLDPILDLDLFFGQLYNYYLEKGLWCIITSWVVELLGLGFIICFSGFLLLFVDWGGLSNAKCGIDAVESGIKPCDLGKQALHQHPLSPLTVTRAIIVGYLGIFSIYWVFCFLRFFAQLKDILRIRHFYYNSLHVTDSELQTTPWPTILEKIVQLQSSQKLCVVKDLSAHDIMMRLMRKENFLIAMVNKRVLAFDIPSWFPGAGPAVIGSNGRRKRLILTKTLEWTLNWCILQSMFDRNFCIRRDFISNPEALRKRCKLIAVAGYILSPFLVIFVLVYFFLRHAEQLYNHPRTASSRKWSNLSKWILREFNEADHIFQHRLNSSIPQASNYIMQFPSPIISIIAKFISFVSGGFAAILIMIAFMDESLLEGHIFGRNLFWYMAVFGTVSAASRTAIADVLLVLDAEGAMSNVVQHSHYMPKKWRGREHTQDVREEFATLFKFTLKMLMEEIASIFLTPYLLLFVVPKRVDDILQFISNYTVHVEGVGDVCSFSVFDFRNHGNSNYASPCHAPQNQRSSQGKMEKSFLSFQSSYPSWEPDPQGKQFLSNLRTFRDEMLGAQATNSYTCSPPHLWLGDANLRNRRDQNSFYSRQPQQDVLRTGTHLGSLWPFDINQRNHPYLLDWYYTCRPHNVNVVTARSWEDPLPMEVTEQQQRELWAPPNFAQNEVKFEGMWGGDSDNLGERSQSHMGASTSDPLFRESMFLQQDNYSHTSRSHWWDRNRGGATNQVETSFIEPPDFNQNHRGSSSNYLDSCSEQSAEEWPHQQLMNPRLSRTMFLEDLEAGDVSLHFDDVYSRPPETPRIDL